MADNEKLPPDNSAPDPKKRPGTSGRAGKSEGPGFNRLVLIAIFLVAGLMLAYQFTNASAPIKKLTFGEFEKGLESGEFNPTNVHGLVFGHGVIHFQDQPKDKTEKTIAPVAPVALPGTEAKPTDAKKTEEPVVKPQVFEVATASIPEVTLAELKTLLKTKKIDYDGILVPSDWQSLVFMLMLATPFVLFFVIMMRRLNRDGGALSFGRSRGRLYAQDDVRVTFKDIAGIPEAVEELKEIVDFLRTPEKYKALGGRIPRGVLLVGPPGTGKTLLAKAVAGEAGVPFVSLSGSDFVEMFVGVGAARVRDMFQQAADRSPSIIFIDELDAIGKARSAGVTGSHEEREQTLNALLVEMDGFGSDQNVIVVGATNRPETLDPALMRPGRFDRHVLVDRPDVKGREGILEVHAKKIKMDESVNLVRLAKLTGGFVGADLANLVNEAALLAARKDKKSVTMKECEEAIERVIAGLEKTTRIIPEDEKRRTAYHECGHALVASSIPHADTVHKISIIPRGMAAGYTIMRPEEERGNHTRSELIARICGLLGGIAAEQLVYAETSTGVQNDLQRATDIARRMITEFGMSAKLGRIHFSERRSSPFLGHSISSEPAHSEDTIREIDLEVKQIIEECFDTAYAVLVRRRKVLEQMTKELMETEVMDMDHLRRILDEHYEGPAIAPGTLPLLPNPPSSAASADVGASSESFNVAPAAQ